MYVQYTMLKIQQTRNIDYPLHIINIYNTKISGSTVYVLCMQYTLVKRKIEKFGLVPPCTWPVGIRQHSQELHNGNKSSL